MNKIFYQHIVKTGGQALATRIASAFPVGRSDFIRPGLIFPEGIDELASLFEKYDFVECHVRGQILNFFNDLDILVTVRDPIKQIVSNFFHIRRENRAELNVPANRLSPEVFFAKYGDFFCNTQARSFVMGYRDISGIADSEVLLTQSLFELLEKPKWFVPTEKIDDFCTMWQMETKRRMALPNEVVNVANVESSEYRRIESIVNRALKKTPPKTCKWYNLFFEFNEISISCAAPT